MKEFQAEQDLRLEEKLSDKKFRRKDSSIGGFFSLLFKYFLIFLIFVAVFFVADHIYYRERVYPGVKIENFDVGGMTLPEVKAYLGRELSLITGQKQVHFYRKDGNKESLMALSLSIIGIEPRWEHVLKDALRLGRRDFFGGLLLGDPFLRYEISAGLSEMNNFPIVLTFNREITDEVFGKINELIEEEPINAAVALDASGGVQIVKDIPGLELDYEKTMENIIETTKKLIWKRESGMLFRVEVETAPVEAALKERDLEKFRFDNIKASFTTGMGSSDANRRHNIRLASEKVHNTFLMPGDVFSFNETVGHANASAGYLESLVIVDGDFTAGVGGGICQVSTTLYNAAVLAGMEIKERHLHSRPVSYVDEGDDATINFPNKDLKIANSLSGPVIIGVLLKDKEITVNIHGR